MIKPINIVIPCRNVENTLKEAVKSVINQVIKTKGKIILVENESTDNTLNIALDLQKQFKEVIVKKSKLGKINSLLKGFEEFNTSEPIFCMDGDVKCKYNNLHLALEEFKKHPSLLVVGGVPKIEEFSINKSIKHLNLSGLFPRTKKVTDISKSFDKCFEDPQDNLPPEIELQLKPFFHGRLFCLKNKTIIPKTTFDENIPEDIFWNRYIFYNHGPNSIRILQKIQVYYEPFQTIEELISYRTRIKSQVNILLKKFPKYKILDSIFSVHRDKAYIKTLSFKTQLLFQKEEEEIQQLKDRKVYLTWHGEKYDS